MLLWKNLCVFSWLSFTFSVDMLTKLEFCQKLQITVHLDQLDWSSLCTRETKLAYVQDSKWVEFHTVLMPQAPPLMCSLSSVGYKPVDRPPDLFSVLVRGWLCMYCCMVLIKQYCKRMRTWKVCLSLTELPQGLDTYINPLPTRDVPCIMVCP